MSDVKEATTPPSGFKAAYARIAKDPAEPSVLSDILGLVGYNATAETIDRWSLSRRVQAEAYAVNEHLRASDNILRKHPRPEWMPEPWLGPDAGGIWGGPGGTPLTVEDADV